MLQDYGTTASQHYDAESIALKLDHDDVRALSFLSYSMEAAMTAFNIVRFKVKSGMEEAFLDAHRNISESWSGMRHANIIKTGEGRYCIIAEWESLEELTAARPQMISTLDSFRQMLEDLGGGLGITDPVSGPVVLSVK
jgi:Antibiotic biosynthesis monooxygenase